VVARRRQQILPDLVVPAWGQIDVLDVSGHLTIKDCADEEAHSAMEALFVFFDDGLVGEVVFQDLSPGSFVAAFENILELGESLVPVPVQLRSCLDEIWEGLLVKNSIPRDPLSRWTSAFPALPENLYFSGSFVVSSHSLSWLKMGSFSKILAILAVSIDGFFRLSLGEI
jgi:hypothetical protein